MWSYLRFLIFIVCVCNSHCDVTTGCFTKRESNPSKEKFFYCPQGNIMNIKKATHTFQSSGLFPSLLGLETTLDVTHGLKSKCDNRDYCTWDYLGKLNFEFECCSACKDRQKRAIVDDRSLKKHKRKRGVAQDVLRCHTIYHDYLHNNCPHPQFERRHVGRCPGCSHETKAFIARLMANSLFGERGMTSDPHRDPSYIVVNTNSIFVIEHPMQYDEVGAECVFHFAVTKFDCNYENGSYECYSAGEKKARHHVIGGHYTGDVE